MDGNAGDVLGGFGSTAYHDQVRRDVAPLLPARTRRVLEIGCGTGATLAWLKAERGAEETIGVEIEPAAADAARGRVDRLVVGDLTRMDLETGQETGGVAIAPGSLDLVMALDVLEHLPDPWDAVRRLTRLLAPDGALIASLPNVAHFSVSLGLALGNRWRYADWGILDRTHLRFFVRDTAVDLLQAGGLVVDRGVLLGLEPGRRTRLADRLTLGRARHLLTHGFILRAVRAPSGGAVRWSFRGDPA
ncbi:class I SAM-dependent methyltransferase [Azospirillum sp.]|uniref:class I SAM-dependent methyltransferase n=1 Tax=Azospirillum sp. TaxID=34012 RepID=UPI002D6AB42A|nr:class I SAM-dependent methyltransferase [Azospirillum sp.]HYD65228.1 class I SAM-dependent methyltransferase [Azospirillum sp.]